MKPEIDLENSFDFFDSQGIYYNYKNSFLKTENKYLIGTLEEDESFNFIDLK